MDINALEVLGYLKDFNELKTQHPSENVENINIDKFTTNKDIQPRITEIDTESLQALMNSIKANGQLDPILYRENENKEKEIICGERRWLACQMLGNKKILARKIECSEQQAKLIALLSNTERENLMPLDIADAIKKYVDETGIKQKVLADFMKVAPAYINQEIKIAKDIDYKCKEIIRANPKVIFSRKKLLLLSNKTTEDQLIRVQSYVEKELNKLDKENKSKNKKDKNDKNKRYAVVGHRTVEDGKELVERFRNFRKDSLLMENFSEDELDEAENIANDIEVFLKKIEDRFQIKER